MIFKLNFEELIDFKIDLPLTIFTGNMCSVDFQHYLSIGVIPFIRQKFPYRHRLFMDNDPKVINIKLHGF